MPSIAIAEGQPLIYEGENNRGHGLWPSPVLSIATVLSAEGDLVAEANDLLSAELVFREDSFDPVTRIRRGRLYKNPGTQPQDWWVQKHPAYEEEVGFTRNHQGWLQKRVYGFDAWPAFAELSKRISSTLIALGTQQAYTLWSIVSIERIVTGEDLVTLRARASLGMLPELNVETIPESARSKVVETIEKLAEAAYRAGPESIVDRARDAAQWCLGVWIAQKEDKETLRHKDLSYLAKKLGNHDMVITQSVAQAIARLHARGKPNEQDKRGLRPVTEADAEFSLAAIGLLLRELGWAN